MGIWRVQSDADAGGNEEQGLSQERLVFELLPLRDAQPNYSLKELLVPGSAAGIVAFALLSVSADLPPRHQHAVQEKRC